MSSQDRGIDGTSALRGNGWLPTGDDLAGHEPVQPAAMPASSRIIGVARAVNQRVEQSSWGKRQLTVWTFRSILASAGFALALLGAGSAGARLGARARKATARTPTTNQREVTMYHHSRPAIARASTREHAAGLAAEMSGCLRAGSGPASMMHRQQHTTRPRPATSPAVVVSSVGWRCHSPARRLAAVAVGLFALGVCASSAQAAPTITVDRPCFSFAADLALTGHGFTPGGQVAVSAAYIDGPGNEQDAGSFTLTADATGTINDGFDFPQMTSDPTDFRITAEDKTLAAQGAAVPDRTATLTTKVSGYGVFYRPWNTNGPAHAHPGRRAKLEILGFIGTVTHNVYAHYVLRGRPVKTLYVGRLHGACGLLTVMHFRQFAFRPVPPGNYRIVFDTWPQYNESSGEGTGFKSVIVRRQDAVR
jgi:hypothetical protein